MVILGLQDSLDGDVWKMFFGPYIADVINARKASTMTKGELPRLSGSLRAFGDICAPWAKNLQRDPDDFARKQQEVYDKQSKAHSLETVKEFLLSNSNIHEATVVQLIKKLRILSRDLVGSDASTNEIEGACLFLLETFKSSRSVGQKEKVKMKNRFSDYPQNAIEQAFELVKAIVESIKEEAYSKFLQNDCQTGDEYLEVEEFGSKIKFLDQEPLDKSFYFMQNNSGNVKKLDIFEKLTFKFNGNSDAKSIQVKELPVNATALTSSAPKCDKHWLESEIKKFYPSSELAPSIVNMLKSDKTNESLQGELFDLLGFDRYELITDILKHRAAIIVDKSKTSNETLVQQKNAPDKPSYLCQVTIQSEAEKMLTKQIRKDEKRISKVQAHASATEETPAVLDARYLKAVRESQLSAVRNMPYLPQGPKYIPQRKSYPNVYDLYTEVTMSAAFVSGRKLGLPEGHRRIDNPKYEEINIPAAKRMSASFKKDRISISSLDNVGKSAFSGMKELNLIQSMVFKTAYNTNENMLVCAPTGAGKTNVAMLTIIHEIRNNLEGDTVKKDKFKIVYVAPMKALASEMVKNFGKRLQSLGIQVKELTGDMQLTKNEIMQTQMLVTTPEKWDVVTRKSTGDVALTQLVKLLILDEVHLLDSDRGPVLEAIVARTLRQVESTQSMIRILGLSATLPNYIDVARFLRVNPMTGLFFFDDRFRPVPLSPTFIGVKSHNPMQQAKDMEEVCYDKVLSLVQEKHQVMVFVHARKATVTTATILKDFAVCRNHIHLFTDKEGTKEFGVAQKQLQQYSRNKELKELFNYGFSIHHAGMLRHDRDRVERYFSDGLIKVLVCTSTLAWGVNLPARAVVIKGTEIYDSKHGNFIDLGVLDVMQIFGRAGRPQFDNHGEGIIITEHKKLQHYLSLLTRQHQIESKFRENLEDNLNAEIGLGTVTNISEGVEWLSYTYLYIRMLSNPLAYGLKAHLIQDDFQLQNYRKQLIVSAAMNLDKAKMIRYDDRNGYLHITDLGRTASHYYISKETVSRFHEELKTQHMDDGQILHVVSVAKEFDQLKVREDEMNEMDHLLNECLCPVKGGCVETEGKVNILIQMYLSGMKIEGFSLISDQVYVMQNATRIIRFLFEVALRNSWAMRASCFLRMSKMFERRLWDYQTPLRQFSDLHRDTLSRIDKLDLSTEELMDLDIDEIGMKTRCQKEKHIIKNCLIQIPNVEITPKIQPITHKILRLTLYITPDFKWVDRVHGHGTEPFWIWIEDPETDIIYHFEYFMLTKKQVLTKEMQTLVITLPLDREVRCDMYFVRVISDRWLGSDRTIPIRFNNLILPHHYQPQTELLDLQPLPVRALQDRMFEMLYKFEYFNPIQTQIFHTLYHTDNNVLLGAPTGSGKTIAAEIAMFRLFKNYPGMKVVYIAPLKALVRERMEDWKNSFVEKLQKNVVELTGDVTPDMKAVAAADVIVTTPEKWDGISRSWQTRNYVKTVGLMVIDEIHLLGQDRGPVLEVIVSRTNFISGHTEKKVRVVGLSTALANATDLAEWLGIKQVGLYNFKQSVRPVPLEIHVSGYPGKHYCPRMALMNKPTYQAIQTYSPDKPTLVFVSSRRQTRLTALDLIAYLAAEDNPRQWVHMSEEEGEMKMSIVRDQNLKLTLAFGIGLHHAGLHERDRKVCEDLFLQQKIQVLIATATLAWGVNLPAHLVVIKGTEYFDGKVRRYVDFPITDVLQMMGRAGRPQFDDHGIAVVLVQDIKKGFYKKFLYDPFPVESSLIQALPDHLNAEIVAGTISSKQQALDYLTWTFFFRRLLKNPIYYSLESIEPQTVNQYLSGLVNRCLNLLQQANCITVHQDERQISSTILGHIASYYYLSHRTLEMFRAHLKKDVDMDKLLWILCEAHEYDEIPVRHNEDSLNEELAKSCPKEVNPLTYDNSHTKTNLLLQAHFCRLSLPCTDYYTDLKSVLDQAIRIIQAMVDVSSDAGFLMTTLGSILLLQMILQARWYDENALLTLPHIEEQNLHFFKVVELDPKASGHRKLVDCLPELMDITANRYEVLASALRNEFAERNIEDIFQTLRSLPRIEVRCSITGYSVRDQGLKAKKLTLHRISGVAPESCRHAIHAKREYILDVTLSRLNKGKTDTKAIAPKFPKQKNEGWFLVLGNIDSQELIAMKRIPFVSHSSTHQLVFYAPETKCDVKFTLFLMSDCYLGLDQQYDIYLEVKDPITVPDMEDEEMDSSESSSENSDDD